MVAFYQVLYIGVGGFFGAVSRFLLSRASNSFVTVFPAGTLVVNMLGSFVLGFILYSTIMGKSISPELRDFSTIGFLGSFTTMSTFSYESIRLLESHGYALFLFNVVLNLTLCLAAVVGGRFLAMTLFKL